MPVVIGEVQVEERPAPTPRGEAPAEGGAAAEKKDDPVRTIRREAARRARVRAT